MAAPCCSQQRRSCWVTVTGIGPEGFPVGAFAVSCGKCCSGGGEQLSERFGGSARRAPARGCRLGGGATRRSRCATAHRDGCCCRRRGSQAGARRVELLTTPMSVPLRAIVVRRVGGSFRAGCGDSQRKRTVLLPGTQTLIRSRKRRRRMYESSLNPPPGAAGGGPLVLLVEDERSIAEPFANALQRAGFRTTVARTATEAISQLAAWGPDVVLLDLALPDGDGRDVCRQLRRDSERPDHHGHGQRHGDRPRRRARARRRRLRRQAVRDRRGDRPDPRRAPARPAGAAERGELRVRDLRIDLGARRAWRSAMRSSS